MTNIKSNKNSLKAAIDRMKCVKYGGVTLINGDSFEVMRELPDNSIDCCITDPPYGIGFMNKEWDNFNPKAIKKGTKRKNGAGISSSMFAGKYDTSRNGAVRYQQFCYKWATEVLRLLKPGAALVSFCSPRMYHRMVTGIEDAGFEIRDQIQWLYGSGFPKSHNISKAIDKLYNADREIVGPNPNRKGRKNWDNKPKNITLPATKESKYWDGWGTGLKPSNEPIVLARKPISEKSIARNVLLHGTAGINIDSCRIGEKKRFPSNTIISKEAAELLGDKAKFFYSPKISKKERNAGCEHLEARRQNCKGKQRTYNDYCAVCGKRFIGSPNNICQCPPGVKKTGKSVYKNKNHHPTVKPIALMEYLVKLVTPKGGVCLDIFMGSGSTAISCSNQKFDFLGVEICSEYFEIAKARIKHWQNVKKVA